MNFADIILPFALPQLFTYFIPIDLISECEVGKRVVVQFGKRKYYTGLIYKIHENNPINYEVKEIVSVLDNYPVVNEIQLKLWEWITNYYMCTIGEVYKAAIPAGMKIESETKIYLNEFDEDTELNEKERIVIKNLETKKTIDVTEITDLTKLKQPINFINNLVNKGAVRIEENLRENYKAKKETYIRLSENFRTEDTLKQVFDRLAKSPKQLHALMLFLQITDFFSGNSSELKKSVLLEKANISSAIVTSLVDKEIFIQFEKEISRLEYSVKSWKNAAKLNEYQQKAYNEIQEQFKEKQVVLFHGITSSGKTEIYIHLIQETLQKGKQVLYLLPEIALTTQIITRLQAVFGEKVGVYHSKFSDAERVEIWQNLINDNNGNISKYQIILGVRSAIFLPFSNLGLIIVDEEHENTYKQQDPAPRYNARDVSIILANLHKTKCLLATATPSLESYFNARNSKWGFVELNVRYQEIELPEIVVVDTKLARKRKLMQTHFSQTLLIAMQNALNRKEQIILFQNRRGFAPLVECKTCGWVPKCEYCDVSLTYHKYVNQLICHYCGYTYTSLKQCKACGDTALQTVGFGTEKIEDEMALLFPKAKIARMDLDTTRARKAYQNIISEFEKKNVDILIGTQMVSKGLDFDNVSLVGILNADSMLNFPDFRAFERSFQMMAQVSGRAGRKGKRGLVVIQTANPEHEIVQNVMDNAYKKMYQWQITERIRFKYPPFFRLISITLKHKDLKVLNPCASSFAENLRKQFGNRILGPESPPVGRVQNFFLKNILIKIEREKYGDKVKEILINEINEIRSNTLYRSLVVAIDVDPL